MKSGKINLIVMKNGGQTHSWNLKPQFFYMVLGMLILIPILFILSIWLNTHLYKEYTKATKTQIELQYIVDRNTQTVARLNNLERFLRNYSPDLLGLLVSQTIIDTLTMPAIEGANETLAKELDAFTKKTPLVATTETAEKTNAIEKKQDEVEKPILIVAEEITPEEIANKEKITEAISSEDIKQHIDLGYVTLAQVQVNVVANKLDIKYSLHNTGKTIPLLGEQQYTLINVKNGKITRTLLTTRIANQFRISNLKQVKNTAILVGIEVGKMARIQIDTVRDGTILFRETYPISR